MPAYGNVFKAAFNKEIDWAARDAGSEALYGPFATKPHVRQLLEEKYGDRVRVVTVPGKEFGMEGHLRLSYCGTIKEIMDGMERIKWALDPQSPNELFLGDRKLVRDWA